MMIDVPDSAVKEAEARGIAVEDLLKEKFLPVQEGEDARFAHLMRFGPGTKTPAEAAASMREMAQRYTLRGQVTIKQLIEEGRRY